MLNSESDLVQLVQHDKWMMDIMHTVKSLDLPDWWICAGFVRSKVWDVLHGFDERSTLPDIDVIYYDDINIGEEREKQLEDRLNELALNLPWSVKNQARMHIRNNASAYTSSVDAMAKFPETATAIGMKLDDQDGLVIAAPHGIEDLINLDVKPTPYFLEDKDRLKIYEERVSKKNWPLIWHRLKVHQISP
ncbi:nucleotidyltransferase family protein [Planococcus sp. SSTMD024]|uniref:nucleotidyltransferase family protein n=1 Tax=Planococcus sp. SSTMD024 TaxID=3242163 RepID=UPI00351F514E